MDINFLRHAWIQPLCVYFPVYKWKYAMASVHMKYCTERTPLWKAYAEKNSDFKPETWSMLNSTWPCTSVIWLFQLSHTECACCELSVISSLYLHGMWMCGYNHDILIYICKVLISNFNVKINSNTFPYTAKHTDCIMFMVNNRS